MIVCEGGKTVLSPVSPGRAGPGRAVIVCEGGKTVLSPVSPGRDGP